MRTRCAPGRRAIRILSGAAFTPLEHPLNLKWDAHGARHQESPCLSTQPNCV